MKDFRPGDIRLKKIAFGSGRKICAGFGQKTSGNGYFRKDTLPDHI